LASFLVFGGGLRRAYGKLLNDGKLVLGEWQGLFSRHGARFCGVEWFEWRRQGCRAQGERAREGGRVSQGTGDVAGADGLLLFPVADVVLGPGYAVFTGGEEVVAVGIAAAGSGVLVLHTPRIERHFLQQLAPAAWRGLRRRLGHERLEALFGARRKPVHAFINHELGLHGLKIAFDLGVFGNAEVVAERVGGDAGEEADDHDDHHDFDQGESGAEAK